MRHILLASLAIFCAVAGFLTAAEPAAHADCCNVVCPIDGNVVDSTVDPVEVTMGDAADAPKVMVGTCSKACAAEIVANPKKYRVPAWTAMKDRASQGRITNLPQQDVLDACCNTTCAVDGKPIDTKVAPVSFKPDFSPAKKVESKQVLVGFCSHHCMDIFTADPKKYAKPAWMDPKHAQGRGTTVRD